MKTQKVNIKGSLELKQGEILNGRVIKQDAESNKVILKLINGMEIQAEVEADVDLKGILLKFELAEVKDNVLFLKVLDNNTKDVSENVFKENTDEIMNFILKEGLKKEDYNMLKAMIKYNIPLTRENITKVKSMLEFSDKMNNNPKEIKNFINSYLNSRDIVVNSREGLQTAQKLYEFFEAFSKIDVNEVLLFLENNIEFSKENLDSFNKLFNSEDNIEKVIDKVNEKIGDAIAIEYDDFNENIIDKPLNKEMLKQKIDYVDTLKKNDAEKVIQATLVKEKANSNSIKDSVPINIINNISITDDEAIEIINLIKSSIKNSIKNDSNYDDYNNYNNNINREYSNKEYSNFYNDHSKGYNEHVISKEIIKESIFNQTGREILLTDDEAKSLNVIINKEVIKDKDISFVKNLFKNIEDKQQIVHKDIENNYINKNIKDIKKDIVDIRKDIVDIRNNLSKNVSKKSEGAKEVIRNIISNLKEGNENSSQILNIMKNNINDLKLFNKINNQYYCLDVPVNFKENEYPCKLIIKDDRKDGKVIDSSNFKVAISVKTVNLGTVDALLDVRNKNIYLKLKCDKNVMNLFIMEKDRIKDILESSGFISKIEVIERIEELELSSCREFFNDNNIATVDIKV